MYLERYCYYKDKMKEEKEKPIYGTGTVHIDDNNALRIRIKKKLAKETIFKNKDEVKVTYYPIERKLVVKRLED